MTVCTMNARCNACERSILACVPDRTCAGRADCALNGWNRALDARDELLREAEEWLSDCAVNCACSIKERHSGHRVGCASPQAAEVAARIRAALGKGKP